MLQPMTIDTTVSRGSARRQFLKYAGGALLATAWLGLVAAPALAGEPIKVVYHLADGVDQASFALGNLRNQLRGEPDTKIVVVALGAGLNFLLQGAKDRNGEPFAPAISALAAQGVEFRACNNTMKARNITPSMLVPEAKVVPAGVVEIARLQAREGYVYFRP
ncbi:DsrE family protein [Undibacterium arcticum]|uniref:DsrE family protein n=1 Tax=Undibacterium arcticum TaxID=1762892 RepID=A0ABV7EZ77_9BURK